MMDNALVDGFFSDTEESQKMTGMKNLDKISKGVNALIDKIKAVKQAEDVLKEQKKDLRMLQETVLPDLMEDAGMSEFVTTDGISVKLKTFYNSKITDDNQAPAWAWLEENGHDGIIKTDIKIQYGKGDKEQAEATMTLLNEHGIQAESKEGIHHSTLNAFVREQVEAGTDIPREVFGVYEGKKAEVR